MHEIAHIEWVPPFTKSVTQKMNFGKDGITTLSDLNKHEDFFLHNGEEYWNMKVKDEFLESVSTLWDKSYYDEGLVRWNLDKEVAQPARQAA